MSRIAKPIDKGRLWLPRVQEEFLGVEREGGVVQANRVLRHSYDQPRPHLRDVLGGEPRGGDSDQMRWRRLAPSGVGAGALKRSQGLPASLFALHHMRVQ